MGQHLVHPRVLCTYDHLPNLKIGYILVRCSVFAPSALVMILIAYWVCKTCGTVKP